MLPGSLGSSGHPVQEGGCEEQEPSCYTGETQCSCAPAIAFLPSLPPTSLVLEIMMTEPLAPSLSAAATVFHCACVLERAGLGRGPGRGKCLKWKCLKICLFPVAHWISLGVRNKMEIENHSYLLFKLEDPEHSSIGKIKLNNSRSPVLWKSSARRKNKL